MATTIIKKKHWLLDTLTSTLGRKLIMSLTGVFLILFLVVHLIGNLQLLKNDGGVAFNRYADFMGNNPLIQIVSIGNFFFIILHIVTSIILKIRNRSARPTPYAYDGTHKTSWWSSRNMMLLGTILLIFLVVHLQTFWARSKFGGLNSTQLDGKNVHDLYEATQIAFAELWIVGVYVLSMVGLAFHLSHGFQSAFQSVGLNHKKYSPAIHHVGIAFAVFVPTAYALIPVLIYFKQEDISLFALMGAGALALGVSTLVRPRIMNIKSIGGAG